MLCGLLVVFNPKHSTDIAPLVLETVWYVTKEESPMPKKSKKTNRLAFTEASIKAIEVPAAGREWHYDAKVSGLADGHGRRG